MKSTKEEKLQKLEQDSLTEDSTNSFMEPAKKGRGRPKGSKNRAKPENLGGGTAELGADVPPAMGTPEDVEKIKTYLRPVFGTDGLVSTLGVKLTEDPAAKLGVHEAEILIDSAANCVNQYLPGVLGAHANLIVFSLTMGQWGLRVYMLRQAKIEEIRAQKRAGQPVEAEVMRDNQAPENEEVRVN